MLYIVLQKDIDFQKLKTIIKKKQIRHWIYLGEDTNWRIHAEKILTEKTPRISIADALDYQAWNMRQSYIEWIGKCSEQNDSQEWWASETPSKDPFGLLYLRICFYAVGRSIIRQGFTEKTIIICNSSALVLELIAYSDSINCSVEYISPNDAGTLGNRIIRSINKNVTDIVKTLPPVHIGRFFSDRYAQYIEEHPLYRKTVLNELEISREKIENKKTTIMLFTYVDNRNFTLEGKYQDPHFGPLTNMLKDRGYEIVFVARILQSIPYKEAVTRLMKTGDRFFFQELFISNNDLKKCNKRSVEYFPKMNENTFFGDIPVYKLIKEHLVDTQNVLTTNLLIDQFISNMAKSGNIPYQIMYTCEGQSWESALIWSIRKNMPETKIVAFDNVTFSKLALSMFPAQCEFSIKPLPDVLVTNGPLYSKVLLEQGYPPDLVKVGCALRHSYLWKNVESRTDQTQNQQRIQKTLLVASAGIHSDSIELISKIAEAFGGDQKYNIIIKCHPFIDVEKIKRDLGIAIAYENIFFSNDPIRNLLPSADILFYTYTSVCYEALQFKVPPVCVHLENFFNLDKLDIAPDVRWVTNSREDLQKVVSEIIQMNEEQRQKWEKKALEVVKTALAPVEPDCINVFIAL